MPDKAEPEDAGRRRNTSGVLIGVLAIAVAVILIFHGLIPNIGGYASLFETFLPWLGVAIILLAVAALIRFSRLAGAGVLVAAIVWCVLFGPAILPHPSTQKATLTVASENIHTDTAAASEIAKNIASKNPDVIALQELDNSAEADIANSLATEYPYHVVVGTVGLWSKAKILNSVGLHLGLSWRRAVRVDVATAAGVTRIYVVHMASVRPGEYALRNTMLATLDKTIEADHSKRLLVIGDFNSASTDRAFTPLTAHAQDVPTTGFGLGFTWPAAFPVARLDHALVRGLTGISGSVLAANGSDHRGIIVGLR